MPRRTKTEVETSLAEIETRRGLITPYEFNDKVLTLLEQIEQNTRK